MICMGRRILMINKELFAKEAEDTTLIPAKVSMVVFLCGTNNPNCINTVTVHW